MQPIILIWLSFQLFFTCFCYPLIFFWPKVCGSWFLLPQDDDITSPLWQSLSIEQLNQAARVPAWSTGHGHNSSRLPAKAGGTLGLRCRKQRQDKNLADRVWEGTKLSVKWLINLHLKHLLNRTHFLGLLCSEKQVFLPVYWKMFTSFHLWHQSTKVCNYTCSRQDTDITSSSSRVSCYYKLWDNPAMSAYICIMFDRRKESTASVSCTGIYWYMETRVKIKKAKQNQK